MASRTEDYVRNLMRPALRRQFQPIALRIIAEGGGTAEISLIRQAIVARHPEIRWDRRYPIKVLEDNGIVEVTGSTVRFTEQLDAAQTASLLSALDNARCARRVFASRMRHGVPTRLSGSSFGAVSSNGTVNGAPSQAVSAPTTSISTTYWRGSLLAAVGWSPAAINDPINLQLLCPVHHADKTAHEVQLLAASQAMTTHDIDLTNDDNDLAPGRSSSSRPDASPDVDIHNFHAAGGRTPADLHVEYRAQFCVAPMHTRTDVLASPCPVPNEPGAYGWWFRQLPAAIDVSGCLSRDGLTLLYTGISPRRPPANGSAPSKENLRKRVRYHYTGNAEGSTLRKTLGILLADQLGIELRRVGSGTRMTFGVGEQTLSGWMDDNAFVSWIVDPEPWIVEAQLIADLDVPLNLDGNAHNAFHPELTAARSRAVARARTLPVIPNTGRGGR